MNLENIHFKYVHRKVARMEIEAGYNVRIKDMHPGSVFTDQNRVYASGPSREAYMTAQAIGKLSDGVFEPCISGNYRHIFKSDQMVEMLADSRSPLEMLVFSQDDYFKYSMRNKKDQVTHQ